MPPIFSHNPLDLWLPFGAINVVSLLVATLERPNMDTNPADLPADFPAFASGQGVSPESPWVEIIDCACAYFEAHVRPCPDNDDDDRWWSSANAFAARVADTFAR